MKKILQMIAVGLTLTGLVAPTIALAQPEMSKDKTEIMKDNPEKMNMMEKMEKMEKMMEKCKNM